MVIKSIASDSVLPTVDHTGSSLQCNLQQEIKFNLQFMLAPTALTNIELYVLKTMMNILLDSLVIMATHLIPSD